MKEEKKQKVMNYEKVPLFVAKLRDSRNGRISDIYSHPIAFRSLDDALSEMEKVNIAENIVLEEVRLAGYYLAIAGRVTRASTEDIEKNIWRRENDVEKEIE